MNTRIAMRAACLAIAATGAVGLFTTSAFASGPRNIVYGDTGADVTCVQQAMNDLDGAGLSVDGRFGNLTRQAVENYQSAQGLGVDGQVGTQTGGSIKENMTNRDNAQIHEGNYPNAYSEWLGSCSAQLEG